MITTSFGEISGNSNNLEHLNKRVISNKTNFNNISANETLNQTKINSLQSKRKNKHLKTIQKKCKINNRRYLGNKYKLLSFIKKIVDEECKDIYVIADIFAGTGAVASAFIDKKIITNDILYSNYICHVAWFGSEKYSKRKIKEYIALYNQLDINENNYMTLNFSDTFFSRKDCAKIGYIREDIEYLFTKNKINKRERALLITSLLYAMDKIANTCGHYDAYRKNVELNKELELLFPDPPISKVANNECYNIDTNQLVKHITADLVYVDPPYNSRQYCDAYHLLENIATWQKPEVFGVAKKMERQNLKSDYCTKKATEAFNDLIQNIKARYILLSYNNMAEKGNERSNAKINDEDILKILQEKGEVKVFTKKYKPFTTGKSNIKENEERIFLCKCYPTKIETTHSPLNYMGGKYKLLPQLLPLFPKQIDTFIDLFCGGCNVGLNVPSKTVIFNDKNKFLQSLYLIFQKLPKEITLNVIYQIIKKYNLSLTNIHGYEYFGCNSSDGLAHFNKANFNRLKEDFNNYKTQDNYYYIMLYVLIVYSFNNQIRFNNKGQFNLPVGKRDFNSKMKSKLIAFIDKIQLKNYSFTCFDFRELNLENLNKNSFIYLDPPYLITCASYNESKAWHESDEIALLNLLDRINEKGIKFALSNVLESNGKKNVLLINWLNKNADKYHINYLSFNYSNSNYQRKDRQGLSKEVLITNYKE